MNSNEHFYIVRSYLDTKGHRRFQIAGDMEDSRFPEGTVWNVPLQEWESAYDDGENEENDLIIADLLAQAIEGLKA